MNIRRATDRDFAAIDDVVRQAFDTPAEVRLVSALRNAPPPVISLVAWLDAAIVGHIMFTPVRIDGTGATVALGLAPVSVAPQRQGQGIGSALVMAGLAASGAAGAGAVVVLGEPGFYRRFGFHAASRFGIDCAYDPTGEAFMALELHPGCLASASGTVRYHPAFDAV